MASVSAVPFTCFNGDGNVHYVNIGDNRGDYGDKNIYEGQPWSKEWFNNGDTKTVDIPESYINGNIKITVSCGLPWHDYLVIKKWDGADIDSTTHTLWLAWKNYRTKWYYHHGTYESKGKGWDTTVTLD